MCWTRISRVGACLGLVVTAAAPATVFADANANLDGIQEVPSVYTDATGNFRANARRRADEIAFKLSYAGIETNVLFAHIHFAERRVNGGVLIWLCDTTHNAPVEVAPCPQGEGTVDGVITDIEVTGAPDQGIDAGDIDALIEAVNAGATYVNVHSAAFPAGEIRGQIEGRLRAGDEQDDRR